MSGTGKISVAHLTTVHRPFDVRIFHKQCVSLAAAGYDVTLIQRGEVEEVRNGVTILPVPSYPSRLSRMTRGVWIALKLALKSRAEIIHLHDPELIPAGFVAKLMGRKVVLDIHENLHLDIAAKQWLPRWCVIPLGFATQVMEQLAAATFDGISAATDGIARRFSAVSTIIVRNAPVIAEMTCAESTTPFEERPANFIYVGGLGGGGDLKGVDLMLSALAALPSESSIRLILGGPAPDLEFAKRIAAMPGGERIDYIGWVDRDALARLYAKSIGALVLYPPMPNNIESEPVKLFEAMAAGVPVVISDFPLFREYLDRWQCGIAVEASNANAVAHAMLSLEHDRNAAQAMGSRGQEAIRREREWPMFAAKLDALYRRIVPSVHA